MASTKITVYETINFVSSPVDIDLADLLVDIQAAAYRFWLEERRMPSAVVVHEEIACRIGIFPPQHHIVYGELPLDEITRVPLLGRSGRLDPLFFFF